MCETKEAAKKLEFRVRSRMAAHGGKKTREHQLQFRAMQCFKDVHISEQLNIWRGRGNELIAKQLNVQDLRFC